MPIVKLSQVAKGMLSGETARIESTDAAFRSDLEAWARRMGLVVCEFTEGATKIAVIEKG